MNHILHVLLAYAMIHSWSNRVAGYVDLYSLQNGGDAMKNQSNFDFKDMLTFGIFLLSLLTFVFTFCK